MLKQAVRGKDDNGADRPVTLKTGKSKLTLKRAGDLDVEMPAQTTGELSVSVRASKIYDFLQIIPPSAAGGDCGEPGSTDLSGCGGCAGSAVDRGDEIGGGNDRTEIHCQAIRLQDGKDRR